MPNFQIAQVCNQTCPYCFAEELRLAKDNGDKFMSMENVRKIFEFLHNSDNKSFSIIGGEPTLHPHFTEIVSSALDEGFNVFVFTNALMKRKIAEFLSEITTERLGLLININKLDTYSDKSLKQLNYSLSCLGEKASLGFNIYSSDFDFTFLVDTISKNMHKPIIRLGIAQPIFNGNNQFAPITDYVEIADKIVEQVKICDQSDIAVGFDCGFVLCMFTSEQLGFLNLCRAELSFSCHPVVDVGPNLEVWSCFALTNWKKLSLLDYSNSEEIEDAFRKEQLLYRRSGIFNKCFDCNYIKRGQCSGGCISHVISDYEINSK